MPSAYTDSSKDASASYRMPVKSDPRRWEYRLWAESEKSPNKYRCPLLSWCKHTDMLNLVISAVQIDRQVSSTTVK